MKILELRFKNLNSLYGEWLIDFRDPNYLSNGIFSLTGPTGAGKSTILDAICLALYGKTPRLAKINKSENELMSRQTGECSAEVLFETQTGLFRCHWEQRRARKKANGNLQDAEHYIFDNITKKIIEEKKSLVLGVIEEKTGMDFERFTRSVLLAQGGFDSFLKAGDDEKSKILEQLTGSKIYSEISQEVYQRQKTEKDTLNLLLAGIAGIEVLPEEEINNINNQLDEKKKQEKDLGKNLDEVKKAINWYKIIADLQENIGKLEVESKRLQEEFSANEPLRKQLAIAKKASQLEVAYTNLISLRKLQTQENKILEKLQKELPDLEKKRLEQNNLSTIVDSDILKIKEEITKAAELFKQVRSLDQAISQENKRVLEAKASCHEYQEKIDLSEEKLKKEQRNIIKSEKKLVEIRAYLEEYKSDEWLVSNLTGIEHQLSAYESLQQVHHNHEKKLNDLNLNLKNIEKDKKKVLKKELQQEGEIALVTNTILEEQELIDNLLNGKELKDYRVKKESLSKRKTFLDRVKSLEDSRQDLRDNQACPLCGSLHHPFAENNAPQVDDLDVEITSVEKLIAQIEAGEESIKKQEKELIVLKDKLRKTEKEVDEVEGNFKITQGAIQELTNTIAKNIKDSHDLQEALQKTLQPLKIIQTIPYSSDVLLETLKSRLANWKSKQKEKEELEKSISEINAKFKTIEALLENHRKELIDKQVYFEKVKDETLDLTKARKDLFGDNNPDKEEKILQVNLDKAEKNKLEIQEKMQTLQEELTKLKTKIDSLKNSTNTRAKELIEGESTFTRKLHEREFKDEKHFLDSLLNSDQIDHIDSQVKKLNDDIIRVNTRIKDNKDRLVEEERKNITDKSKEELDLKSAEYLEFMEKIRDDISVLKLKILRNNKAKEEIKEKEEKIELQKREFNKWDKLNSLIGSADGKKYRNFAQGLTFEMMVKHANRQLQEMSERYLLIRDRDNPLELNVIDNYQAGEIRSTKNLSGGESFIVSLALALGLSKMASHKVRVDSLFLDEGFGTLDEEALETALESLSGLHQAGKLIGIISHVSSLKDRISTQISITPITGGRSVMEGPGVSKLG
ncbi:AAA family ATPase [bacterium]|nr:AAA family ATPase [bacterium]